MFILKVWQLMRKHLILAKQDPLEEGLDRKKGFLTLFWWENMIFDMSSGF